VTVIEQDSTVIVARFNPRSRAKDGDTVEVCGRHARHSTSSTRAQVSGSTTGNSSTKGVRCVELHSF